MTGTLIKREKFGHMHTQGRIPCEDRGGDWGGKEAKGPPKWIPNPQKLGEQPRTDCPSQL